MNQIRGCVPSCYGNTSFLESIIVKLVLWLANSCFPHRHVENTLYVPRTSCCDDFNQRSPRVCDLSPKWEMKAILHLAYFSSSYRVELIWVHWRIVAVFFYLLTNLLGHFPWCILGDRDLSPSIHNSDFRTMQLVPASTSLASTVLSETCFTNVDLLDQSQDKEGESSVFWYDNKPWPSLIWMFLPHIQYPQHFYGQWRGPTINLSGDKRSMLRATRVLGAMAVLSK